MNISFWTICIIVIVGISLYSIKKLRDSTNWNSTTGEVISSSAKMISNSSLVHEVGGVDAVEFSVDIKYEYTVNGLKVSGSTIMAGMPGMKVNKVEADSLIKKYSKGSKVDVFYNPTKHTESALITGKKVPLLGYIVSLFFLCFIILSIYFVLKSNIFSD